MGFEIGKRVADYEIVELLGTSKTGVAYKVRNVFAQRFEVLKILPKSIRDDEEQNARFLREIKVHAQLLHPNIVTFYNAREIEGQLVMTKEFVPGVTVAEKLQTGPIAWLDVCRYGCQALSALEYAHAHGIIHRGLSSSRLIVTPEGIVRLNGFGLAKSVSDPELTAAGAVIGALKYMSPEQVKGDTVDARCDIYSLGIVLFEMLAGKLPFNAKSQFDIMLAHVNTPPERVSDVNSEVPRELGDAIAKALAKAPGDRFQNAREFRDAIEHVEPAREVAGSQAKPALNSVETPAPVVEPAPIAETAASVPPPLPDAWAIESALSLAESKLASMELKPAPAAFSDSPAIGSSWESTPPPTVPTEPLTGAPAFPGSTPVAWWPSDSPRASNESERGTTVSEPVQAAVATPTFDEALEAPALEPVTASSVPPASLETVTESSALPQNALPDWWTPNSHLTPAESNAWDTQFALSPPELEPTTPVVATPAGAESDPAPFSGQADLWTTDWPSAVVEPKSESKQLELLSAALEPPVAPVESPSVADGPAFPPLTLYSDLWATNPAPPTVGSEPAAPPLARSTPVDGRTSLSTGPAEPEEAPLSLWTSGPPDTWVSELLPAPPASKPEAPAPASLSAAIEPPKPQVDGAALIESPEASPILPQEPPVIESKAEASQLALESAPEPPAETAAAVVSQSPVVTSRPAPVNPDLLTALFGDTLLSRVSLALVICAITFFLGTVTLFAVLSVTKP